MTAAPTPALYDSAAQAVRPLVLSADRPLTFYACGVTPYAPSHVGHARSFVLFDSMARAWRRQGHAVRLVRNRTDIDDKIIAAAAAAHSDWAAWSERWANDHRRVMDRLGVVPTEEPKVSDHIGAIQDVIARLIERGHAYATDQGNVYFATRTFATGTNVAHQDPQALRTEFGAGRVAHEDKRHDSDFALWKSARPGEPAWVSPWGRGRPGWHIECSAMIEALFGDTLTVHGGGVDLKFPHHQCEVCQSEAAFDRPLAHHWIHHGAVLRNGQKMSKSLGNVVGVDDALARAEDLAPGEGAAVVRWALLRTHWQRPLDWTDDLLPQAAAELARWRAVLSAAPADTCSTDAADRARNAGWIAEWDAALAENFNTPKGAVVLHRAAGAGAADVLRMVLPDLGLDAALWPAGWRAAAPVCVEAPEDIAALARARDVARRARDWAQADALRQRLTAAGWAVTDRADGFALAPLPRRSTGPR